MKWSLYFVCMIIQAMLLFFYNGASVLPIRKNYIFLKILYLSFIVSILNILSCFFDVIGGDNNAIILIALVYMYYGLLEYIYYQFFLYGINQIECEEKVDKNKYLYKIPFLAFIIWLITSYFTHSFVYINENSNLSYGPYYDFSYFFYIIYAVIFIVHDLKMRGIKKRNKKLPHWFCFFVLTVGTIIDGGQDAIVLTGIVLTISELMIFMVEENPEFYIDHATETYNLDGFLKVVNERIDGNKKFYLAGFKVDNGLDLRQHHGTHHLYSSMRMGAEWFCKTFPDYYIFNPENESIVALSLKPIDVEEFAMKCEERYKHPFCVDGLNVFFVGRIFTFTEPLEFSCGVDIVAAMDKFNGVIDNNGVHHIGENERKRIEYETRVEEVLQKHIEEKTIEVYYQPIYSIYKSKVIGVEALARLIDTDMGFISPECFIPLAEKNGFIRKLGLVIFEKICIYLSSIDLTALGIEFVNVNLSVVQCQDFRLAFDLKNIADGYGIPFSLFDFEITETGLTRDIFIEKQINALKEYGAWVSLDDFGQGNSNLERLNRFQFSISKLDKSLVWGYFEGKNDILEDIINIFKKQNLKIVAEGVETKEMVDVLTDLKCDYLQGYYFSKPLTPDMLIEYLKEHNK